MSPGRQWAILAVVAAVVVGSFILIPALNRLLEPKPPPPAQAPPPGTFQATPEQWATLSFATAQTMDFMPSDSTEGKIATDDTRTTAVFSPYTGRITRVMAKVGDHVRAGQPLFAVNAAEFVQGQSDLLTAGAQVRLAKATLDRQEALLKENGAAVKDVQQAQSDYATALANLEAARNRLRVLGMSAAQIAAIAAAVGRRGIVPDTVVVSPITGVVTQRSIGPGQNLASLANNGGGTPAFTVSDLSRVWLVGDLREADAPLARVGEAAEVRVGALPGRVFRARVDFVSPVVDPTTRRVTVRASIPIWGRAPARDVRDLRSDHRTGRARRGRADGGGDLRGRHGASLGGAAEPHPGPAHDQDGPHSRRHGGGPLRTSRRRDSGDFRLALHRPRVQRDVRAPR